MGMSIFRILMGTGERYSPPITHKDTSGPVIEVTEIYQLPNDFGAEIFCPDQNIPLNKQIHTTPERVHAEKILLLLILLVFILQFLSN